MSAHTPGLLRVVGPDSIKGIEGARCFTLLGGPGIPEVSVASVIFAPDDGDDYESAKSDAKRLADCWNAFEEADLKAHIRQLREALQDIVDCCEAGYDPHEDSWLLDPAKKALRDTQSKTDAEV